MKKVLVVGSTVVDLTFYTKTLPQVGETLTGRFAPGLGGKGFNQAVASAKSGARTAMITALGQDSFADPFVAKLRELEIESAVEKIAGSATGAAAISVDERGRNNIIVALGANEKLTPAFLEKNTSLFEDAGVLLLQLETNLEAVDSALRIFRKKNPDGIAILNPAPARKDLSQSLLSQVDLFTPNETELEAIVGQSARTDEEVRAACASVRGPRATLVTLGEKGSAYWNGERLAKFPAFRVNAIDTTGAGDAFNGGLASGLALNQGNLEKAIAHATAVAAISVTRPGTSASMPSSEEVRNFLARGGSC